MRSSPAGLLCAADSAYGPPTSRTALPAVFLSSYRTAPPHGELWSESYTGREEERNSQVNVFSAPHVKHDMRTVALLFAVALLAEAQPAPPPVRRVIDVKHLTGDRAERAVRLVNQFMHPVGNMNFDQVLRVGVIVGPEEVVKGAEALFARLDNPAAVKPDRQIQFRFYLVEGAPDAASAGPIPSGIASAVDELKKTFVYKGYRLIDTIPLLARSSASDATGTNGVLPAQTERTEVRASYDVGYRSADILEDARTVMIRNLRMRLRLPVGTPGNFQWVESQVSTDLTIQEGQKLLVGKLSSEQSKNATFLLMTVDVQ